MHLFCIGLNHRTAQLSVREALAIPPERQTEVLSRYQAGDGRIHPADSIVEMVILSTCNRTELYALAEDPDPSAIVGRLVSITGTASSDFSDHLYQLTDDGAVDHLFRVASGLDSMVLGEPQILGQVADAYSTARRAGSAGRVLSRLFQTAVHIGKRARSETAIGSNPTSIPSIIVGLTPRPSPGGNHTHVLVVGAGEMAGQTIEAFRKRGFVDISVVNRTQEKAAALADRWGSRAWGFEALERELEAADVVITSTSAPHTVISRTMLQGSLARRRQSRPMVIIDIALPRDVDPSVRTLPGVRLYDLDSLQALLEHSLKERLKEVPLAEAIIDEGRAEFSAWFATLAVSPLIAELHAQAEELRSREMARSARHLDHLCQADLDQIDVLTRSLVDKLLMGPTLHLKDKSSDDDLKLYAQVTRQLFHLDGSARADGDRACDGRSER